MELRLSQTDISSPGPTPGEVSPHQGFPNTPMTAPTTPNFPPLRVTLDKSHITNREFKELKAELGQVHSEGQVNKEQMQELLTRMRNLEQRVETVEEKIVEQERLLDDLRRDFDREKEDRQDYQLNLDSAMTQISQEIEMSKKDMTSLESNGRISQLEKDLGILVKEHQIVEKENRQRDEIASCTETQEFYQHCQLKLSELFYAAKVISSGMVDKTKNQSGSQIVQEAQTITSTTSEVNSKIDVLVKNFPTLQMFTFAHETLAKVVPFMGIITGSVSAIVNAYQSEKNKQEIKDIKSLNLMVPSITELNDIAEKVARKLTLKYEHQLKQLTTMVRKDGKVINGGIQLLAECSVARIIDFLKATDFIKEKNFVDQLVFAVFQSASSNQIKDPFLAFKKPIPTKLNLNWSDKGIFSQAGICVDGKFFVSKNSSQDYCNKAFKYGYYTGTREEVEKLMLEEEQVARGLLKTQQSWIKGKSSSFVTSQIEIKKIKNNIDVGKTLFLNPKYSQIRVGAMVSGKPDCVSLSAITYDSLGYRRKPVNGASGIDEFEGTVFWKENVDYFDEVISVNFEEKTYLSLVFYAQVENMYKIKEKDPIEFVIYEPKEGMEIASCIVEYDASMSRVTGFALYKDRDTGSWVIKRVSPKLTDQEISTIFPRPVKINITILRAKGIIGVEEKGQASYPYCYILFNNQQKQTSVKSQTLNPEWNETLSFNISTLDSLEMAIEVYSQKSFLFSHPFLGVVYLDLSQISSGEKVIKLSSKRGSGEPNPPGLLYFKADVEYNVAKEKEKGIVISESITIEAPVFACLSTICHFEYYPVLLEGFKSAEIIKETDTFEYDVKFSVKKTLLTFDYVLQYKIETSGKEYSMMSWKCLQGPFTVFEGYWEFKQSKIGEEITLARYFTKVEFDSWKNETLGKVFFEDSLRHSIPIFKARIESDYGKESNKTVYDW